jgi:hypothetical protein
MGNERSDHFTTRIARKFCSNVRVLFNQIIEESRQYETLYSVADQIEQNYHGRFAVELIQNANDAMRTRGRVRFIRRQTEGCVFLYVANDGIPFGDRDFENICDLGLSDKDPSRDIGNKGFGFRSVLEVTTNPRIYSRDYDGSPAAGYCFEFGTRTRDLIRQLLTSFARGDGPADEILGEYLGPSVRLYPPDSAVPQELRQRLQDHPGLIEQVPGKVQVYSYPRPLQLDGDAMVQSLWAEGFASVIALPLDRDLGDKTAQAALAGLRPEALLFLTRANRIEFAAENDEGRPSVVFSRGEPSTDRDPSTIELRRAGPGVDEGTNKKYRLSTTDLEGAELLAAQVSLPTSWKPVTKAHLSVAVAVDTEAVDGGFFAIGLPTEMKTGSGVWVDAPFYGDISRKHIDFDLPLNHLLLSSAAAFLPSFLSRLCKDESLAGSIAAIRSVDFTESQAPLAQMVLAPDGRIFSEIASLPTIRPLSIAGHSAWDLLPLHELRFPPQPNEGESFEVLTAELLARYKKLPNREYDAAGASELLKRVAHAFGGGAILTWEEVCEVLDDISRHLRNEIRAGRERPAVFQRLYNDLWRLLQYSFGKNRLLDKLILLDSSLELHRQADAQPIVFDQPQRTGEDTDISGLVAAMPDVLSKHIRFLHEEAIERTPPGRQRSLSMDLLRGSPPQLVRDFELGDLVNDGIIRCYAGRSVDDEVGRSLLRWAYHLWHVSARGAETYGANWKDIWVPTRAGWRQAHFAYFSTGWDGEVGRLLEQALSKEDTVGEQRPFLHAPEEFLRLIGPPPVMREGDDPIQSWLSFLGGVLRVNRSPRVVSRLRANAQDKDSFNCWGHTHHLAPRNSAMKHELRIPQAAWERFLDYLEGLHSIAGIIRGWKRFSIDRFVTIDGIDQLTAANAAAFFWLVSESFDAYKPHLTCTLRREDSDATTSIRSTLGFVFMHAAWIPIAIAGAEATPGVASDVLYVDPSDLSRNPSTPMKHDLFPHVPRELATPAGANAAKELGVKSPDEFDRADGMRWLAWYQNHWPSGGSSIWRGLAYDLIERAAKAHATIAGGTDGPPTDCSWDKVLIDAPSGDPACGERLWKPSSSTGDGPVFIPDQPVLANQLRGRLPLLASSTRHAEILELLTWRFGKGAAQLVSALETVPFTATGELTDLESARTLQDVAPWLIRAIVSVLALGRPHQRMAARTLKETARHLSAMHIVIVEGLDVRVRLPGGSDVALARKVFAWPKRSALVVDCTATDDLRLLLEGIGQYLNDQDLAKATLYQIHSFLGKGLTSVPTDEELTETLVQSGFDRTSLAEVRRYLTADTDWILQRLLPGLLCIAQLDEKPDYHGLIESFERGFDPDQPSESVLATWQRLLSEPPPGELGQFVAAALSDRPVADVARLAHSLWRVSLTSWNDMAAKVAPASANIQNAEAPALLLRLHEHLLPAARALLREELTRVDERKSYRSRCHILDSVPACPEEAYLTWTPSTALLVTPMAASLAMIDPTKEIPTWAVELIPKASEGIGDVIARLAARGLVIRDDEDAVFRVNAAVVLPLLDQLRLCGLARWSQLGQSDMLPPPSLFLEDPHGAEEPSAREELESLLAFDPLTPDEVTSWLGSWWVANDLTKQVAALPIGVDISGLVAAWGIGVSDLDRIKRIREELRQGIRRIQHTRQVLGKKYVVPDGDLYLGLRQLIDENLNPGVGADVNPASPASLGRPPGDRRSRGSRGAGGNGTGVRSADEFAGAIGEYIAFTVMRKVSGGRIRESAWKSTNRRHFTDDGIEGNDDLGFDFEFTLDGTPYQVEVKATKSHRPAQAQLGPSEVGAANEAVNNHRVTWQIWLVSDVLGNPQVTVLSNPYAPESRNRYYIDSVGARIHFQLKNT